MKFLESLYQWLNPIPTPSVPHYGRGVYALPNPREHELFDDASRAFIEGERLQGFEYFLASLVHSTNHLTFSRTDDVITFTLMQGSAIVRGTITHDTFEATSLIAHSSQLHVALKRRFLERNFQLTYGRFSEQNGTIILSIRLNNATITPQKIFFPLREISLNADYEKEMIASEFNETLLIEYDHLQLLASDTAIKLHAWMLQWIQETKKSLLGLLSNDNSGMVSFSYLALLLQIDYLIVPRKKMAKDIAEKINGYFLSDEKLTETKNAELEAYLNELETMDTETFASQIYRADYTFSPFDQAMHDEISAFIEESLSKVRWYKNNHANYVTAAIYRYIALYVLYNYGLHPTLRSLMHLHVQIYCADFFEAMGEKALYHPDTKRFEKALIKEHIEAAISPYKERFKGLQNFADELNYEDLDHFSYSYYLHIKNLDFMES